MRLNGGTGISVHNIIAVVLLAALFVLLWWTYPSLPYSFDVSVWQERGEAVEKILQGSGEKVEVEYPPLVTTLMYVLVSISTEDSFYFYWAMFVVLAYVLVTVGLAYLVKDRAERWWLPAAMLATTIFFGLHLMFERFDFLVAIALFLCWRLYAYRRYLGSGIWLAVAAVLKITPLFLIPILFILVPADKRRRTVLGLLIGIIIGLGLPALVLGPGVVADNVSYMLDYHGERGVEVGSTWSGVSMLWHNLQNEKVLITEHHGAMHNMELGSTAVMFSRILMLIGLVVLYYFLWTHKSGSDDEGVLLIGFVVALLWMILVSPVLSPQYLIWVVPLVWLWFWTGQGVKPSWDWRYALVVALMIVGGVLTQVVWPAYFRLFIAQQELWLTVALNARNLVILLWLVLIGWDLRELMVVEQRDQIEV